MEGLARGRYNKGKKKGDVHLQFLVISTNKIKITLTREDIEKYSLSVCREDKDAPPPKGSIVQILSLAREAVGFDATGHRLLVQYYPLIDGGELFVTRLTGLSENKERLLRASSSVTLISPKRRVYRFCALSDVRLALLSLSSLLSELECTLYFDGDSAYYLVIFDKLGDNKEINILSEYGSELPDTLTPYIAEHARAIADNEGLLKIRDL